jgi:HK97 family phage major capsid protein
MSEDALMEDSLMGDEAIESDPEAVLNDVLLEEAAMQDEALMNDDPSVAFDTASRSYRRQSNKFAGKSVGQGDAAYWRNRAMKAELGEAPGQRKFATKGITGVVDQADRPGAYGHAFKSYLYNGLGLMNDNEKYVLRAKGRADWGATKSAFQMDSNGSIKTYFGGSDASVGFAVPPDWVSDLNKNILAVSSMAGECKTRTTTSDRIVQPNVLTDDARRAHRAVVRWPGEVMTSGTPHRTTEDVFSQIDIPIHVMLMSLTAGNSALEDVTFSLEEEINEAFSEAVGVAYDTLIWGGDGQGKLEGIVANSQVVGHPSVGTTTVGGYVPTGSNDGIVNADVLKKIFFNLPTFYRQRAKWYMNSNTAHQIATLKNANGDYMIEDRTLGLTDSGAPEKLFGRPIVYNEFADDIATGAFPVIFGDLSRTYVVGKRVDFTIKRFDDSNYAELDQVLYMGRARIGGQVFQAAGLKVLKIAES